MPFRHPDVNRELKSSDAAPSDAAPSRRFAVPDNLEYIVRPSNDVWMIEHAGDRYGPYKNCREATFFAVDAARKLGAQGKNTRVKAVDHAGHVLTRWNYSG